MMTRWFLTAVRKVRLHIGTDSFQIQTCSSVTIQNTTFGGTQGFSKKPSTVWTNDRGEFAGIVHQERNWTFVLFTGAGHLVPQNQPENVGHANILGQSDLIVF